MATNNAINTSNPIEVAKGGTGRATLTNHGVLVGATTSAITQLAVGTNGQVMVGATGADPAFATLTSTGSTVTYTTGANTLNIDVTQPQVLTSQPAFQAYLSSSVTDVTGDGTSYDILFDAEVYDQAGNFNTGTGVFTAPVTGIYLFTANIVLLQVGVAHTAMQQNIVATGTTIRSYLLNPSVITTGTNLAFTNAAFIRMTSGDTCKMNVIVSGSTKTVDINGGNSAGGSYFSGALIC